MNKINQLFERKKKELLSIYFCAGYPELNNTVEVIRALARNGVDMIEIGIPFSDPMADGVEIQRAASQALKNGMTLKLLFEQLSHIRQEVDIPLLLMGYLNPVLQYGFENFCSSSVACGINGCIIPDLPFEEYLRDYKPVADKYDIKMVLLITPETSEARIRRIDDYTDGFIYMVSSAATTGTQQSFDEQKRAYFRRIQSMSLRNPLMIGFGISNKDTFHIACEYASGAIIGSKFITLQRAFHSPDTAIRQLIDEIL